MVSLHTVTILWFCSGSRFNWTNHFNILLSQQQPQSEGSDAYVGFDEFYHHGRRWSNSGPTGLHSYQPYSCTQGLFLDQNIFKVIQNIPRNWKWLSWVVFKKTISPLLFPGNATYFICLLLSDTHQILYLIIIREVLSVFSFYCSVLNSFKFLKTLKSFHLR